ncbi:MAG: class I SAM-dependent DNA methyltransferase [Firmicutes bacterium]|nr:class I SAM-dependent DNA methyltransferase [Bacillota bacterium]
MPLSWDEIQANAVAFSKRWKDARREHAEKQPFLLGFFSVFGIIDPLAQGGSFEYEVRKSGASVNWIDYFWPKQIAIEMKTRGKSLGDAYTQLKGYMDRLPPEDIPDLWMVSDFDSFQVWRHSTKEKLAFKLKDLRKFIKRFASIAGYDTERVREDQIEVNVKAAEKMAKLHDALKGSGYDGHDLEVYLVRLLFCLFAGDTGIFPKGNFYYYIHDSREDGSDLSHRISDLFEVLNMPPETRAKKTLLSDELKAFRYINGGLFEKILPKADFDAKMRKTLLECREFDWSRISPAIFGAMFQGVMDATKRREMGAHYTSEENILKLINPLFLDELWREFERVKTDPAALSRFHDKIARLKFLDPACGCGNFLIITYRELRLLELEILRFKTDNRQLIFDISSLLKVSVEQFYGIEYEDFPCQIAQVGMWLVDHQLNLRASEQFGTYYARLPLTQSATIVHGNALRIDWESVVPKEELSYILGNPPFVGYSNQNDEQKADMLSVYVDASSKPFKNAGKIDYVAAWYYKAAKYLQGTPIRAAFVSTNSITQGEQVAAVWKPLFDLFGIRIDFGYRTFKWSNEAKGKAAVHCVIVGFSWDAASGHSTPQIAVDISSGYQTPKFVGDAAPGRPAPYENPHPESGAGRPRAASPTNHYAAGAGFHNEKIIYDGAEKIRAKNINPYLVDAPNIFIESRTQPVSNVPKMISGNRPTDDGHLIIENEDLEAFINADPLAEKHIKRFMMGYEFINNVKRYCLWLIGVSPAELRKMPEVMKRVAACKEARLNSPDEGRHRLADTPMLFREQIAPEYYLAIPKVSSERRRYIPIGYMDKNTIAGDKLFIVADATLFHFGILTSNMHMAWMRAVCGRLKSDYSYSINIVYNNFPWPDVTDEQKSLISTLAQAVLDARAQFPDSSLADLYDPLAMPPVLLKAHQSLDRAVMKLYNFPTKDFTEPQCVAALMEKYQKLIGEK